MRYVNFDVAGSRHLDVMSIVIARCIGDGDGDDNDDARRARSCIGLAVFEAGSR